MTIDTAKTVLVASAAAETRERFFVALGGAGHRALGAASERELIELLEAQAGAIDLLVLDARIGQDGGAQVLQAVKRPAPHVPVVVFGGSVGSAREVRELCELGVGGFLNEHVEVQRILPSLAPHLFADSFDRRTSARVTLGIAVALATGTAILPAFALNLGSGGMAVRGTLAIADGAQVGVRFRLPRTSRDIEATARVVWNRTAQAALGLQFEAVAASDQQAIDEFVERHADDPAVPA